VDNVCHGIELALNAGPTANGQIFLLSDDDGCTWGEYFGYFARALGKPVHHRPKTSMAAAALDKRPIAARRWVRSTVDLVTSPEAKGLARRVYQSDPWGTPARWFIDTFPQFVQRAMRYIRPSEGIVYRPRVAGDADAAPFVVDPIHARVTTAKMSRVLGYTPIVRRERAMELTLQWAVNARIVPAATDEQIAAR